MSVMSDTPAHLELQKDRGLTVHWSQGTTSFFDIEFLRRMSPSAESRALRDQLAANPLTVLPPSRGGEGPLRALDAELVGNYAIRIRFSDGHDTGLYSWEYLRRIDPGGGAPPQPDAEPGG